MKGDKGMLLTLQALYQSADRSAEFSGTLLGFDDYVSQYSHLSPKESSDSGLDMVLENVTE